ncbi:MAG: hypothetical protein QW625_00645 [Candidatus Nanoarchaeia archaeon]
MVKHTYEIIDYAKELKEKIHANFDEKKEVKWSEIINWIENTLDLQIDLAEKINEVLERLVRLEDEVRKKYRPEEIPKIKKRIVKAKKK